MTHSGSVFNEADRAATELAAEQLGLISTADLLRCGITRSGITRRIDQGLLRRVRPGVYRFAGTPSFPRQRLAEEALSVDATAAVSHDSAAFLWGLTSTEPAHVHVVVRRWSRRHRTSAVVHESLDFVQEDRVIDGGVPLTSAVRTVVDLGATSRWLVESALSRGIRHGLFTAGDVQRFVDRVARRGRRGVGVIRPYLEYHLASEGRTESVLEDRFLRLLHERQVRLPITQFDVIDDGGRWVCRADFAYPVHRLIVELDGREYHSDTESFQLDRDKQNRTQALGWTTLRFTWHDVTRRPDYTIATVRQALAVLA